MGLAMLMALPIYMTSDVEGFLLSLLENTLGHIPVFSTFIFKNNRKDNKIEYQVKGKRCYNSLSWESG